MKKVIIIGGGFAGSNVACKLEKHFDVTLIDAKNYYEFTPSILRSIVQPEHIKKVQVMHRHYLHRAHIVMGCVTDVTGSYVKTKDKKYPYDYLVICSGSSYSLPIKEKDIVKATRATHLRDAWKQLCKAKKVLLVGGGLVGVELAAEIIEHYPDKEVIIVHSGDKLITRNHHKAIQYADKWLRKKGVSIIFNHRVLINKGKTFITDKGMKIKTDIAFLCTGIKVNSAFMKKHFKKNLNKRNQIIVNTHLQIEGSNNIFAAGDCNDRLEEKTAQNAERQAAIIVKNINNIEKERKLKEYHCIRMPMVISLGKWNGIFEFKGFVWGGLLPGIMKTMIEWKTMWKYR